MIIVSDKQIQCNNSESISYLLFKSILKDARISMKNFVELWNKLHPDDITTTQSLSNKLARNSLRLNEFLAYIDILDYSLHLDKMSAEKHSETISKDEVMEMIKLIISEEHIAAPKEDIQTTQEICSSEGNNPTEHKKHGYAILKERTTGGYRYINTKCHICNSPVTIEVSRPIQEKVAYCSECGKQLDDRFMNYCPNCGVPIDKFEPDNR